MGKTIIGDMDGVFADFNRGVSRVFNKEHVEPQHWNYFEDWGMTADDWWAQIHSFGDEFYEDMVEPYPWKDQLLHLLWQTGHDLVIMSSPSNHPCGYAAKKIWCDLHLPGVKLIVGSEKHLLASANTILIDDYDKNIVRFLRAGGSTITFPQPWNAARHQDRLPYVQQQLEQWCQNV